jgi:hypothetical protein
MHKPDDSRLRFKLKAKVITLGGSPSGTLYRKAKVVKEEWRFTVCCCKVFFCDSGTLG